MVTGFNPIMPELALMNQQFVIESDERQARFDVPVAAVTSEDAVNVLSFFSDIAQFRGPSGATRVDFTFLTPLSKNIYSGDTENPADTLEIIYSGIVRDLTFEPLIQAENRRKYPIANVIQGNLPNAVNTLSMITPPRTGELFLQIKDTFDDRLGYSRQYIDIRDFRGRDVKISDIQFYFPVENENHRQALPAFKKENVLISPYPYKNVRKTKPLMCYFEIYNLMTGGMSDNFEIETRVDWDTSRAGIVRKVADAVSRRQAYSLSVTHKRNVKTDTSRELITLDLSELPDGPYVLGITVTDAADKNISAHVEKKITLEK